MNLADLERQLDLLNKAARDSQDAETTAAAALLRARKHRKEIENGDEAKRMLTAMIELTAAAGLSVPANLSPVPLTAMTQLRAPLATKRNAEKLAQVDRSRAQAHPGIHPLGKYPRRKSSLAVFW